MNDTQPQVFNRFSLLYARSLIDLVVLLNQSAMFSAKVIYFGPNTGKSEAFPDLDLETEAPFIAVLDLAPTVVALAEDMELLQQSYNESQQNDGLSEVSADVDDTSDDLDSIYTSVKSA